MFVISVGVHAISPVHMVRKLDRQFFRMVTMQRIRSLRIFLFHFCLHILSVSQILVVDTRSLDYCPIGFSVLLVWFPQEQRNSHPRTTGKTIIVTFHESYWPRFRSTLWCWWVLRMQNVYVWTVYCNHSWFICQSISTTGTLFYRADFTSFVCRTSKR